jgi:hypothetical protein
MRRCEPLYALYGLSVSAHRVARHSLSLMLHPRNIDKASDACDAVPSHRTLHSSFTFVLTSPPPSVTLAHDWPSLLSSAMVPASLDIPVGCCHVVFRCPGLHSALSCPLVCHDVNWVSLCCRQFSVSMSVSLRNAPPCQIAGRHARGGAPRPPSPLHLTTALEDGSGGGQETRSHTAFLHCMTER